jgi:hypothetical protein
MRSAPTVATSSEVPGATGCGRLNDAPVVSHAFAHVNLGQVDLLKVGNVKGTMSH